MQQKYSQPKHHIGIDCAIFGYQEGALKVLLTPRVFEPSEGEWSLVAGFLQEDETVGSAVNRILLDRIGVDNVFFNEVHTFSNVDRDPVSRVISILHYALVPMGNLDQEELENRGAKWFLLNELPEMIFDHKEMVSIAFAQLQKEANNQLLGKELLPPFFTLLQLRNVYDCIFEREFEPANFRKKIMALGVLMKQPFKNKTESKKGAYYYSFDPAAEDRILDRITTLK